MNNMEMMARMSKRFWLLGLAGLIAIGLLVACGSNYNSASDGLVLVGSQGSNLIETFSFNLNSGHASGIGNPPSISGTPQAIVLDAQGAFAYVIVGTEIQSFKVNSGGSLSQAGSTNLAQATIKIPGAIPPDDTELVSVSPSMLTRDAAGKFLFVANRATADPSQNHIPGSVSVLAIGGDGSLSEVPGSPFFTTTPAMIVPQVTSDIISVAPTPTIFPPLGINGVHNAVCSDTENNPPSSQYLYAVDNIGNQVFEFQVDTSTGVLSAPSGVQAGIPSFQADAVPVGIGVDPCDRFVYVSGSLHNKISAYTICTAVSQSCPLANGALVDVPGSPFALAGSANGAGPLVVDPFGNSVYVLGTLSNTVSPLKISPVSGALTAMSPATIVTGSQPKSIAIRADDNWLFVTNYTSANVSQYSVTPATGALNAEAPIDTQNLPFGVAVK